MGAGSIRVMHVAHVINRYDFIDNVLRHVNRDRFTPCATTFVSTTNIHPPEFAAAGIPHHVLHVRSRKDYIIGVARLAGLLRRHRIDIVHAHHFDPNAMAWAATRLHRPTRLVVGRHYSDDHHTDLRGVKRRAYLTAEGAVFADAARIVAPSTMIRDILVHRQGVPATKVVTIPYPFDPARYPPLSDGERAEVRAELGIGDAFAVATVGRIVAKKGHRYMVQAVRMVRDELPDLVWLVLGDGPGRAEVEALVREAGIGDRVRFLGWRTDALRIIGAADAVAQATLREGFSQAMVEALWMRTPLIMTDVSGARDLIRSGESGLIVPPADPAALAAALGRLHADPRLRAACAASGRAHVERELTIERVVPRFEALYAAVTSPGSSRSDPARAAR